MSVNYSTLLTRGTSSVFKTLAAVDGKIRFVVDSQELYIDYQNQHIKISDINRDYTQAQLFDLPESSILVNKVYFTSDTHQLYFYTPASQSGESGRWTNVVGAHTHHAADIIDLGPYATRQSLSKSDVGLNNVGNFLAVSTEANQGLTDQQKANARSNIGAGSSDFSGDYNDLTNKPTLGTAAAKDVPQSGQDATSIEVVLGGDSRLSNARPASDVYAWAKAETKPSYTKSEVGLSNVGNFLAVSTEASQGLDEDQKSNARANIGAGTSSFSGNYDDLTNKPTIPPAVSVKGSAETEYRTGEVSISPANIGLNYVDNTSDATKKANFTGSIADSNTGFVTGGDVYSALANKINISARGAVNGVASLDSTGKIPASELPSIVDDVLEYASKSDFPETGETGKIYVAKDTNLIYRFIGGSGTDKYAEISPSIKLGETSETAYRGDRGKTAYDHSQSAHARTDATAVTASNNNGNIKINGVETTVYTHPSGTNPHGTTKTDVGLGNVGNFLAVSTEANQGLSSTQQSNARANIGAGTSSFSGNYNDLTNKPTLGTAAAKNVASSGDASTSQVVMGNDSRLTDARPASDVPSWAKASTKPSYTKSEVGLGNVDNTSDSTKKTNFTGSISSGNTGFVTGGDAYTALNGKISTSAKGAANGVAELDSDGKVPASQLPSFVDDVQEYDTQSDFPATGTAGIIYIAKDTNKTYRWGGTTYVEISPSLALGETSSTAYRGDRGKTAYNHATETRLTTATAVGLYKVGATAQGHISGLTAVAKSDITGLGIPAQDTTYSAGTGIALSGTTFKAKLKSETASTLDSGTITTTASRQYAVHPDKSGYLSVNVPWENTTYSNKSAASGGTDVSLVTTGEKYTWNNKGTGSVTSVATGAGLTGGTITTSGTIKVNLASETKSSLASGTITTTANRQYAVHLDSNSKLSVNVPWTDTTYSNKSAASGGTDVSLVTTGEKYTWNSKAAGDHTHGISIAADSGTSALTMAASTKYKLTAGGQSFIFTSTPNTTYSSKTAASGGTEVSLCTTGEKYTWNSKADAGHTHGISIAADSGTSALTMAASTKYKLTAGGQSFIFTSTPNTTYSSKAAASGGTDVSLVTTGEKYTWNSKGGGSVTKVSTGVGLTGGDITTTGTIKAKLKQETASTLDSAAVTTTASRQYAVHPDKSGYLSVNVPWSNTNTTYTFANGTNGFTVTPSGGSAQTVTVTPSIANNITGSGTSGYIAKFNGTNTVTNGPAFGSATTTYLRNDGNWGTPTDTKNTAGSTDTSSKIFLIGATSQAANPQTYSDNEIYATSGVLTTKSVQVGGTAATMQYNSTNKCIDFVFA